jgi:hypothetical protein
MTTYIRVYRTFIFAFSYPNLATTRLLIGHGCRWIDLDAVDSRGDTALHVVSRCLKQEDSATITSIIELLINARAHIDCVNEYRRTPLDEAFETETHTLLHSKQTPPRLKCLCARLINDEGLAYDRIWPARTTLNTFVLSHGGLRKEHSMPDVYGTLSCYYDYDSDIEYDYSDHMTMY